MKQIVNFVIMLTFICLMLAAGGGDLKSDVVKTSQGDLTITCLGHASLMFQFQDKVIYVDPFSRVADYGKLPKADLILVSHEHGDHLDAAAIDAVKKEDTKIILSQKAAQSLGYGMVMANGDVRTVLGLEIEAVPAYNMVHKRDNGQPFHPKGVGNGYIITFGDKRVYVAGDTENTPEMKKLKNIAIAFLPINLPYTMDEKMVKDAVTAFKPAILYPYHFHFGQSRLAELEALMKDVTGTELRIPNRK
jgi:L-ascorbate metabolism protein UlaG (beta-lactamase superfamily)